MIKLIDKLKKRSSEYLAIYERTKGNFEYKECSKAIDEVIDIIKEHEEWISVDDGLPSHTRPVAVEYTNEFMGISGYDRKWTGLMRDSSGNDLVVARWHDLSDPMPQKISEK